MKKIILSTIVIVLFSISVNAQTAKSVYLELGGASLAGFNFDTRFSNKQDGLGGRIGIGGIMIDGEGATFIPIGLNYLVGKDGKNYFEAGAGVTLISTNNNSGDMFSTTFGTLNFGYRYQPRTSGFLFRANISPIIGKQTFFPFWGGISFGYKF